MAERSRWNLARRSPALAALAGLLAAAAGASGAEFEAARVIFEQNATDADVEVVFEVTGGDEGLAKLRVVGPDGRTVGDFAAPDASTLGIRHFSFESPEPRDVAGLKAAYPEGAYVFTGTSASGDELRATATLSHALPEPAGVLRPAAGARDVPATGLEIAWTPVANASGYVVEIEQSDFELKATLPASATTFTVPDGLLRPGTSYQVGIGTLLEGGNVSFVETRFRTAEKP